MNPHDAPGMHIKVAGICSSFELALRFSKWAGELASLPTTSQIRDKWDVSRATAYRWRAAWAAANGVSA